MEKKVVLLVAVFFLSLVGCAYYKDITSSVVEKVFVYDKDEMVEIEADNIITCCHFFANDTIKTCAVLQGYDCSHCRNHCE